MVLKSNYGKVDYHWTEISNIHTDNALSSSRSEAAIQSIAGFNEQAMQACKRACDKSKRIKYHTYEIKMHFFTAQG